MGINSNIFICNKIYYWFIRQSMNILFIVDNNSYDMLRFINLFKTRNNISVDIQKLLKKKEISELQKYLYRLVKKKKITHLIIQTLQNFNWEILIFLKKEFNLKLILISPDCPYNYDNLNRGILELFDLLYTFHVDYLKKYIRKGINAKFFTEPKFINYKNTKKKFDISFVGRGKNRVERKKILDDLKSLKNIKTKFLLDQEISDYKMIKIIKQSKIHLNFTDTSSATIFGTGWSNKRKVNSFKGRIINILGANTFCLSQNDSVTKKLFPNGKGVIYFNNIEDLKKKLLFYINNDKKRSEIISKIDKKYLSNFSHKTVKKRIMAELKNLNFSNKKNPKVNYNFVIIFFQLRNLVRLCLLFRSKKEFFFILKRIFFLLKSSFRIIFKF